jgi:hypothetical protein
MTIGRAFFGTTPSTPLSPASIDTEAEQRRQIALGVQAVYDTSYPPSVFDGDGNGGPEPGGPFVATEWGTVLTEYDFSDASKITATAGAVSAVAPTSGDLGLSITQANAAEQPRTGRVAPSGLGALNFGPNNRLVCNVVPVKPQPHTLVLVAVNDIPSYATLIGDYGEILMNSGMYQLLAAGTVQSTVAADLAWHVFVGVLDAANSHLWIDGVLVASGDTGPVGTYTDMSYFSVGNYYSGGYGWQGGIGHALGYYGAPADIPGLSASLKTKWGTV